MAACGFTAWYTVGLAWRRRGPRAAMGPAPGIVEPTPRSAVPVTDACELTCEF